MILSTYTTKYWILGVYYIRVNVLIKSHLYSRVKNYGICHNLKKSFRRDSLFVVIKKQYTTHNPKVLHGVFVGARCYLENNYRRRESPVVDYGYHWTWSFTINIIVYLSDMMRFFREEYLSVKWVKNTKSQAMNWTVVFVTASFKEKIQVVVSWAGGLAR